MSDGSLGNIKPLNLTPEKTEAELESQIPKPKVEESEAQILNLGGPFPSASPLNDCEGTLGTRDLMISSKVGPGSLGSIFF